MLRFGYLYCCVCLAIPGSYGCGEDGQAAAPDAGDDVTDGGGCELPAFERGDDGHPDPLGVGPGVARAGRVRADQLPAVPRQLVTWAGGDFVLANDKLALVIEDVGASDSYDPWGGRPVGLAVVRDGALVEPADFGEMFLLTGRESVVTTHVTVIADGADGGAAIVRAEGRPAPTPFFESVVGPLLREQHGDMPTAIDYVLEPDAAYVDVVFHYASSRRAPVDEPTILHGFMFSSRMPPYAPGLGFDNDGKSTPYLAFVGEGQTSYAYARPDGPLSPAIDQAGFRSAFGGRFTIDACDVTTHHHARITVGGPGLDPLLQVIAAEQGVAQRELSGVVRDAEGAPAFGVAVHATSVEQGYLTQARTDASGAYALHVPAGAAVELTAYRPGDAVVGPVAVLADAPPPELRLAPAGTVHVVATGDDGGALPVRIQVLPSDGSQIPSVPSSFGEPTPTSGRLHVVFEVDGDASLRVPAGSWQVVVSRGYEYELAIQDVTVAGGETVEVAAQLPRVVDTTGVMCADYHIHTIRSNDSSDDIPMKVRSAVADGLEIPIRSEHEFVATFQPVIEALGLADWAYAVGSLELTSFESFGHFGVVPLTPDADAVNGGAPRWQRYPDASDPRAPVENLRPPEVFEAVRARPERPAIIVNHPRGGYNYFSQVGYNRDTGAVQYPEMWDDTLPLIEVFNGSGWVENLDETVADWLSLLDGGRRVFAVGSSDSHGVRNVPVGYPRTCLALGTDDPRELSPTLIRDVTAAGHSVVSGGIYLDVAVGAAGPGDEVEGAAAVTAVRARVQAASWIDVAWLDVVVDGRIVQTRMLGAGDVEPANSVVRFDGELSIDVAEGGSYVILAVYGEGTLAPVHPGRRPFAVSNPIFLRR